MTGQAYPLRIALFQMDITWEGKQENLKKIDTGLQSLQGKADLVVLPEMCTTGFSMNSAQLAEHTQGNTIANLKSRAAQYDLSIAGSFICTEEGAFYNRAFFINPTGDAHFYDKRHLFRMGDEQQHFSAGNRRCIFSFGAWKINLAVCYDLRFPVWLRNQNNEYDLLILVANWPHSRRHAWETLLMARALENQCYVCGVNRVGTDGNGLWHSGQSTLIDAKGKKIVQFADGEEGIKVVEIYLNTLNDFRERFPVWKDADEFETTTLPFGT